MAHGRRCSSLLENPLVGEQTMKTDFAVHRVFHIVSHEELESGAQILGYTLALTIFVGRQSIEIVILKKESQKLFIITSSNYASQW